MNALKRKTWSLVTLFSLLVSLLPPAIPTAHAGAAAIPSLTSPLPAWFRSEPAALQPAADLTSPLLPDWFAAPAPGNAAETAARDRYLPGWFAGDRETLAAPAFSPPVRPAQRDIPLSLLAVDVSGPSVASLGSPPGYGETYTATVRNNSTDVAYGVYLTATHRPYFVHDGGDQLVSSGGPLPFNVVTATTSITWTPVTTFNLAPGETLTLNFKLRATCGAKSGQQMRVGVRYNADPPPAPPDELNDAGLNATTGRGNLVIKKEPAIQNLGTPDFGEPITWVVTVQNTGLGVLYDATITDTGGVNLSQPSGDLVPSITITRLDVNEVQTYTVVGRVEACNFTNVALGAWPCGNLVGDATVTNPLSSTVSVLFTPDVPDIDVQTSSLLTFSYCAAVTRTVEVTVSNAGGPGGDFYLDSNLESDGFLQVIPASLNSDWTYAPATGVFSYTGGSPSGTIPALGTVTFTFQVRPQADYVCVQGSGQVLFEPHYRDVCTDNPFTADPVLLDYTAAQGAAPTLAVSKSGPSSAASGEILTYTVDVGGENPAQISGTVAVTDTLPAQFVLLDYVSVSAGTVTTTPTGLSWRFDPPGVPDAFSETLVYRVQAVVSDTLCGAGLIVHNDVRAVATPTCPGCAPLTAADDVDTAIENNEGVTPGNSASGSFEGCDSGFTVVNRYEVTGTTVVTWSGATFTEALGTPIGDGALPGPIYLNYAPGSLAVTVNGTDYTGLLTPTTSPGGQLVVDLSPLGAAGAPTQALTLFITYTVEVPEGALAGAVERTFHDWSQLYLPSFSDVEGCAANDAFNQALRLTIGRGDLSVGLSPPILDKCGTNPVVIHVTDNTPGWLTDHVVVTFTSSISEVASARDFAFTGSLAGISPITITSGTVGSRGIITFTLPPDADLDGDGEIHFDVDVNCDDEAPWDARVTFQSRCAVTYDDAAHLDHAYRAPNLILFATPLEYTVREKEVVWKFFLTNNGNLTATDVVVTNALQGLSVVSYTTDSPGVSVSGTLPITAPDDVRFDVATLAPNQQRAVTVTARVVACDPLHVDIIAEHGCFGTVCSRPQAEVQFNTPDPYLLTNNGETADLPMCDPGEVIFATKNASSDVTLYQLNITETLEGLAPILGAPMTMTVINQDQNVIATTTDFTPVQTVSGTQTLLLWRAISATTDVLTWFNALPPLHVVRVQVPVRTFCVPPNTPRSFARASALGPCGQQLGYTEDAVTLRTLQPDMTVLKEGKVAGGTFGDVVYAAPGQTVTWRIEVDNRNTSRSYVAHNVVLSDTWPPNFEFITATTGFSPTVVSAGRTITWDIGDVAPPDSPLEFYITGTVVMTDGACGAATVNATRLTFGCDFDGCTSALVPQDTAQLGTQPDPAITVTPDPLQTCAGDIPITIRNDGAAAYSATLTVTLPGGYVYSHTISSGLTPTQIISTPGSAPRFLWDVMPGRTGAAPYEFTLLLRVRNSGSGGTCPVDDGQPVTATLDFDNHPICAAPVSSPVGNSVNLQVLSPLLSLAKTPRTQPADVGQAITWTLTLTNVGAGLAENVIVTDVVGSNYSNVTATLGSDGAVPVVAGNVVTWVLAAPLAASGGVWSANVSAVLLNIGDNRNVVTATAGCATGCQTALVTDTAYATLIQAFGKGPAVQTGTIGSLVVFSVTAGLPDENALYADLTLTDTLPTGLGYVASRLNYAYDGDGNDGGPTSNISNTPTLTPGGFQSGDIVWQLGDLPGTVQLNGTITAVIQDVSTNQNGVRLTNHLTMTYVDDGQPYVYTDTAGVDVLEPILHLGKRYVTPPGCSATLFADDFNDGNDAGWTGGGGWVVQDGVYRRQNGSGSRYAPASQGSDYSFSAMVRAEQTADAVALPGLYFRYQDSDNYYRVYWGSVGQLRLRRRVNGSNDDTNLGFPLSAGKWYHFEIRAVGDRAQVYVDGERLFDGTLIHPTQGALAEGQVGVYAGGNDNSGTRTFTFDDILVTRMDAMACLVGAGDWVTYTLVVSNQGQLPGYDLIVTDTLPVGMALITYTATGDDPGSAVTAEPAPIPGATGDLVWGVDQLTPTVPFDPADHTALTLTVVLSVSDAITANTVLPNQAFLDYEAWPGGTQPTTITRPYSGGSHSAAVRTVDGGIVKRMVVDPPPTATLGTLVTYTLVVPQPPITATLYDLLVTDTLDPRLRVEGVTAAGGTGAASGWNGQLVTATFASIPHGTQAYVTVTARISHGWPSLAGDADAGDLITNTGVLTHPAATTVTETNEVSTTVGEPLLALVKASDPPTSSTVEAGDSVTYTVRVTNASGGTVSPAYDVALTDTLPVGMRAAVPAFITLTLDGAPIAAGDYVTGYDAANGVLTVTLAPTLGIPAGGAWVLGYVARVDGDVMGGVDLSNQARVTWSSRAGAVSGDRDYPAVGDGTTVHTPPATGLDKRGTPPTVTIGSQVVYTVTVPEPVIGATIYNVVLTDVVDSRLRVDAVSANAAYSGQTITATFASIPSLTQEIVVITATVRDLPAVVDGTQITNVAAFDYTSNPSDTLTSEPVTVTVREPDVPLFKSAQVPRDPLGAGDVVTFTLALVNNGHWPAYDLLITDTLPPGLAFLATLDFSVTDPATATLMGDYPTWALDQLNPGGSLDITFTTRFSDAIGAGLTLTNAAWGAYDNWPDEPPDERDYPIPTDTVPLDTGYPALELSKAATPSPVEAGADLTYTLRVTNSGIVSATGVVITDPVPANTTFQSCAPNPCGEAAGVVSWTLGTLDIGAPRAVRMVVTVGTGLSSGVITNTAWLTSSEGLTDSDTITTPLAYVSLGDLVWYDHDNDGVFEPGAGESGVASVTVALYRPGDVPGVTPPLSSTSTDGNGRYLFTGLDAGGYRVHVPGSAFGVGQPLEGYTSTVPTEPDPNTDRNEDLDENGLLDGLGVSSGIVTLTLGAEPTGEDVDNIDPGTPDDHSNLTLDFGFFLPTPGLAILKSVLPQIGANGQTLTYSVRVTNTGNVPLNPLRLDDRLPDGFAYNDHARIYPPPGGAPLAPDTVAEPLLIWNDVTSGAGLLPGAGLTLTFQVTVATGVTGTFVNYVTATGTTPGGTITDTDDVPIPIEDPAVEIDKRVSGHDRDAGIITFTIHISNVGPSALDVLPLLDAYDPNYLSFVDAVPYPQEDADDGLLAWYDLTGLSPYGFDRDLLPSRQFAITTVFAIVQDITATINSVTVTGVTDRYDNPADDDDDDLPIVDIPTAIELLYLRASGHERGVLIEWATLVEVESYGFKLYRAAIDQFAQAVQIVFQPGRGEGSGAEYTYLDEGVEPEQRYWYWLVEVDNEGVETRFGPVSALAGALDALWHRVYLPVLFKR